MLHARHKYIYGMWYMHTDLHFHNTSGVIKFQFQTNLPKNKTRRRCCCGWLVCIAYGYFERFTIIFSFLFFSFQQKRKTNSSVCAMEFQNLYLLLFLWAIFVPSATSPGSLSTFLFFFSILVLVYSWRGLNGFFFFVTENLLSGFGVCW